MCPKEILTEEEVKRIDRERENLLVEPPEGEPNTHEYLEGEELIDKLLAVFEDEN